MLDESSYRLYMSSNMFHPTYKSIYSFVQCQIKDGDEHAFSNDTIRACRLWLWKVTSRQNMRVDKAKTLVGFFPEHNKGTHCGGLIRIKESFRWVRRTSSESSWLLFKLISIWCVWFFYCYYFAERFSFVESFEIRSFNIRNDVIRMKCWIKQGVNQSNMKNVLDEPENVGWKICSRSNFHPARFFFIQYDFFFLLFLLSVEPIQHFILHGIFVC